MQQKTKYEKKFKILKGDTVVVISGKCKGESGVIEQVNRKKDTVMIAGLNLVHRHTKPSMSNQDGGIVEKSMPLHISNVMLMDPKSSKPTRIGYKIDNGKKVRFAKASGTIL
jgi:large subunit ribosomal protein L24